MGHESSNKGHERVCSMVGSRDNSRRLSHEAYSEIIMLSCFLCLNDHEGIKKRRDVSLSNGMEWNSIEQNTAE